MHIFKYSLSSYSSTVQLTLPKDSYVLHVGEQNNELWIWIAVAENTDYEIRIFLVRPTGGNVSAYCEHCGTIQDSNGYVWHVFEIPTATLEPSPMTTKLPELLTRLEEAKRNERHNNVAESRYWCDQYRQIAIAYGEACRATAPAEVAGDLVEEGLAYFEAAGDAGDKQYVAAIRRALATRPAEPDGFVRVPQMVAADARRYRFLRIAANISWNSFVEYQMLMATDNEREDMDDAIDRAILAAGLPPAPRSDV